MTTLVVLAALVVWFPPRAPRRLRPPVEPSRSAAAAVRRRIEPRLPSISTLRDVELVGGGVVAIVLSLLFPPALFAGPLGLAAISVRRARHARLEHQRALEDALPEMIDLLGLAVAAGLSLPAALRTISPWLPAVLRDLVLRSLARLDAGATIADALAVLGHELPSSGRRAITVIVSATRDGAPLRPNLARASSDARDSRRRAAEARARRLPVVMLLPLVLCILPAFVLLTLVPLIAGSLEGLSLSDSFPPP